MTKQASPEELEKRMSFEDARKSEREWFQTNAPWKDMSNFHNRMGTRNLTKELSRLLGAVINQAYVDRSSATFFEEVTLTEALH